MHNIELSIDDKQHLSDSESFSEAAWDYVIPTRITKLLTEIDQFLASGSHIHPWADREFAKMVYKVEMYHEYMTEHQKELVDLMTYAFEHNLEWFENDQ